MAEQIKEHRVNREGWAAGPWDREPDRIEWRYRGFPCLILRNNLGALCGYVAVPPGHPAHGKNYDDVDVSVHGGLTYGGECNGHICHVPKKDEPENVYWLGFDCAHGGDLVPGMMHYFKIRGEVYRDVAYVRAQVRSLARQLEAMSHA